MIRKMGLKIGIWLETNHISYGGPSLVLTGFLIGLKQYNPECIILLNQTGDYNFVFNQSIISKAMIFAQNFVYVGFSCEYGDKPEMNLAWLSGKNYRRKYTVPTIWYGLWVSINFPFYKLEGEDRQLVCWESGVDTTFFTPLPNVIKKHDYFIYWKKKFTTLRMIKI